MNIARKISLTTVLGFAALVSVGGFLYAQDQRDEAKPQQHDDAKPQQQPDTRPETAKPDHDQMKQNDAKPQEAKPSKDEESRPAEENNKARTDDKSRTQTEDRDRDKNMNRQGGNQQGERGSQMASGHEGRGSRIPDDKFRSSFGRQHTFAVQRPVVVGGRPQFQYGGYSFVLVDAWPVGWGYTDDCYIDYIDGEYFLFDLAHPGVRIAIEVL